MVRPGGNLLRLAIQRFVEKLKTTEVTTHPDFERKDWLLWSRKLFIYGENVVQAFFFSGNSYQKGYSTSVFVCPICKKKNEFFAFPFHLRCFRYNLMTHAWTISILTWDEVYSPWSFSVKRNRDWWFVRSFEVYPSALWSSVFKIVESAKNYRFAKKSLLNIFSNFR